PQTMFELQPQFPGGPFGYRGIHFNHVIDGTSNTLMIAEGGQAVPWTKPEDLVCPPGAPVPKLGGPFKDFFNAAFANGSVQAVKSDVNQNTLRALVTRNGGELTQESDWKFEEKGEVAKTVFDKSEPMQDLPQEAPLES